MTRKEVYSEITQMFGLVPQFFQRIPDNTIELEWELMKRVQFQDGAIPNKYRELIGLGIAAVTKCKYCALFHTEIAKMLGATDAEIEDALHYAKSSAGWSAWLNGYQFDFAQFRDEIKQVVAYVTKMHAAAPATAA